MVYTNDERLGRLAEAFYLKYNGHLLSEAHMPQDCRSEHMGGRDFTGLGFGGFEWKEPVPNGAAWQKNGYYEAAHAGFRQIEVKAIGNKTFLTRNNNGSEASGTIEFELWSNAWGEEGNRRVLKDRSVWTHGWLYGYLHPVDHNADLEQRNIDARTTVPQTLLYVLFDENERPFATVAFENFSKLVERLKSIAPWKLDPWEVKFGRRRFNTMDNPAKSYLLDNMWHVPFDMISDLATVTMINQDPELKETEKACSRKLQEERLAYLKKCAAGRHLNTAEVDECLQRIEEAIRRDRGEEGSTD